MPQQQNRAVTTSVLASLWQGGDRVSAGVHAWRLPRAKGNPLPHVWLGLTRFLFPLALCPLALVA